MAEAANRKSGHNVAGSRSILRIEQFRLADIMRILGIPKWKALNYVKSGHITPSIQDSSGPGTRRIFNRIDLYRFALLQKVTDGGLDLRSSWTKHWTAMLFNPETPDVKAKAESLKISLEQAREQIQEDDWLDRDGRDRVSIPDLSLQKKRVAYTHIDRATPKGTKEMSDVIDCVLKHFGMVFVLEIDRLLDGVDAKL